MMIKNASYVGPAIDDDEILEQLPRDLLELFRTINGFIIHRGALHVGGAIKNPSWHSIRTLLNGDRALHKMYPEVMESDIPFGQDCVGDQFLLRNSMVFRLDAEIGKLESLDMSFEEFIISAQEKPDEILMPKVLYDFEKNGDVLEPGKLIMVFPPFVVQNDGPRSLKAISANDLISFHADISRQLENVPDGTKVRFEIIHPH
jgi:hypothetical protein